MLAMGLLALLVAGVCWSRLALGRHRPRDVVAGLGAGALAGVVFVLLA
jgi:membrane-associated phospholipid phosphatase